MGLSFLLVTLVADRVHRTRQLVVGHDGDFDPGADHGWHRFRILPGGTSPLWIMVTFVLAQIIQSRTYFDETYAVGGNRQAARLAGINTERTIVYVFAITGVMSAIAAAIGIGQRRRQSDDRQQRSLEAIAAVLSGGAYHRRFRAGRCGTALEFFSRRPRQWTELVGYLRYWQQIVTGVILVSAVLFNSLSDNGGLKWWRSQLPGHRARSDAAPDLGT
jgi:ribose/xylose/arabinose/galactoside ABC-type transport system permease subunit